MIMEMLLGGKSSGNQPKFDQFNSKLAAAYLRNLQFRAFQGKQKLKFMVLAVSLYLLPLLDIKTSRTEPFIVKDGQKKF